MANYYIKLDFYVLSAFILTAKSDNKLL